MSSATAQTSASVAELISNNLYDTRIVPQLEEYVLQQVRTSTYDFPPNRHLLSLYLSSPDSIRHDILRHLLFLSLAAYPANHFLSLAYLIPASLQQQQPFSLPFRLHHLLTACLYPRFWAELRAEGTAGVVSAGWEERVRAHIAEAVSKMYSRVSIYQLQEFWNTADKKATEERCQRLGWQLEDEGKMVRVSALKAEEGEAAATAAGEGERKSKKGDVLSEEQLAKLLALV